MHVRLSENPVSQRRSATRPLKETPLHLLHKSLGARMDAFAGFDMPINYPTGIIVEHQHCRDEAALFDVSHMTQFRLRSSGTVADIAEALEMLVPGNIQEIPSGRLCYTMFTNDQGGILDDVIVTRDVDHFRLVGNASRRKIDKKILCDGLPPTISVELLDRALIALQGPRAEAVLIRHSPKLSPLKFMWGTKTEIAGVQCWVSRSGYTGEDGYEISVRTEQARELAETLLDEEEVKPAGLGASDSFRLEAGLCLYGNDLDEMTTPIEAGLNWTIRKWRRELESFPGSDKILHQLIEGPTRRRVGIRPVGHSIARKGTVISDENGKNLGVVTSGGFGPTVRCPIAVGYVTEHAARTGHPLILRVRNKKINAVVAPLPFVEHSYYKR